jgi:hypothetical protein
MGTPPSGSGGSPKEVQAQMRHTQAGTTLYYAEAMRKSVVEEVDKRLRVKMMCSWLRQRWRLPPLMA